MKPIKIEIERIMHNQDYEIDAMLMLSEVMELIIQECNLGDKERNRVVKWLYERYTEEL